jgi:hypothetical protein
MRAICCADAHVTALRVDAGAQRRQTRGLDGQSVVRQEASLPSCHQPVKESLMPKTLPPVARVAAVSAAA